MLTTIENEGEKKRLLTSKENMREVKSLLASTENTRELGGYATIDHRMTKKDIVLRSDASYAPSQEDIRYCFEHKIMIIIDLRSKDEVMERPDGFANLNGFSYHSCPIEEGSQVPSSIEEVPKSYLTIASSPMMQEIFQIIAHTNTGVMIHCSAGKDRTGVISAILLKHAGVNEGDIIDNYLLTKEYLKERFRRIHEARPDLDMRIVTPCKAYMAEFLRLFAEKFQDTEKYFRTIGLSQEESEQIKQLLIDERG